MGKDYYLILNINRNSTDSDIAKAYRKFSLKYHPKLSTEDKNTAYHYFCEVSEAYEVLSDPIKRAFFDKFGEEKLKEGFFQEGELKGGYRFGGNPEDIFEKFYGSDNPFAQIFDSEGKEDFGSLFSYAFGGQNFKGLPELECLEVEVPCTLNELYRGCSKSVTYHRTVLNNDGRTTRCQEESRELQIKPGFNCGTVINFANQGHEAAGKKSSDLIFKIKEIPHPQYKRVKNDLIYISQINLKSALFAEPITIITLDNRKLFISIDEIISPKTVKQIKNEGMPINNSDEISKSNFNKNLPKGDLYIKFDIQFPEYLSENAKSILQQVLPD